MQGNISRLFLLFNSFSAGLNKKTLEFETTILVIDKQWVGCQVGLGLCTVVLQEEEQEKYQDHARVTLKHATLACDNTNLLS